MTATPDGTITGRMLCSQAVVERVLQDGSVSSLKIASHIQSDTWDGSTVAAQDATRGWRIERDTGDSSFHNVFVRGDLISGNWDGAIPAALTEEDTSASQGYYLDSSEGAAQFEGSVWVGGDLELINPTSVFRSGSTSQARVEIHGGDSFFDLYGLNSITGLPELTARMGYEPTGLGSNILQIEATRSQDTITLKSNAITMEVAGVSGSGVVIAGEPAGAIPGIPLRAEDNDGLNYFRFTTTPTFQMMRADGASATLVEVYPQAYIAAATNRSATDITNVSSSGQVGRELTVACEYANQPVLVQMTVDVVWVNVPDGEQVLIRCYINQDIDTGGQAYFETGVGTSDTHSHSHSHSLISTQQVWDSIGGAHTFSDSHTTDATTDAHSHTGGMNSVPLSASAHFETTADGSGNVDIGFWADTQTGTADITENTISYTIWRR